MTAGLGAIAAKKEIFHGVWGSGPKDVWAVAAGGIVMHYDGATWKTSTERGGLVLTGVWGSAADEVFAVGWDGTILRRGRGKQ